MYLVFPRRCIELDMKNGLVLPSPLFLKTSLTLNHDSGNLLSNSGKQKRAGITAVVMLELGGISG